ncbi:hypothetical protein CLAFUW4_05615 [Fulvia fulva]|uniref:Rhodopsin domain-containing protein n=1 Tax=Passalora fulva TaxID=5499 RepID=A0A9Q8LIQ3_PASFU|nr:uncharacterized protein CLAFUR5_05756 [Fulvia fulva]KAK4624189.1 hypothetical protein CLAFUR4_05610 [Fulvia fulva]KAK4625220.1 hypothetical protein CLAFUR0_05618 [Fulvia fulva]UJO18214.1 hypothetical protein CLAFUR5_05756 [Fulvia fulva]WPV14578.1 hypothetical protein CLAFUW4_05615 [Fulvia fulva]WPV30181.1 hypothetical protein CLAFUW7_05614 [Fulvia fulva]
MAYKEQGSSGQRTFMGTVRGGYSICGDEDAVEDAGIQGSWVWLCGSALQERRADGLRMDRFWWDDWSLLPLYALSVAMVPVVHYVVYYGFGQDIWELRAAEVRKYLIWFYVTQPIYMTITFGSKISLLLLYLRTWPGQDFRTFRTLCWSMIVLILLSIVAIVLAMVFQCTPIHLAWSLDKPSQAAHCTDRPTLVIVIAGINILYDVAVISLPPPRLLRLDISWKRKLGLVFVFCIGAIVTVCSCVRIKYMSKFGTSENLTWDYVPIGVWSLVEIYLSIACTCAPATAGLLKRAWNYASGRHTTVTEYSHQASGHEHDPGLKRVFYGMAPPSDALDGAAGGEGREES